MLIRKMKVVTEIIVTASYYRVVIYLVLIEKTKTMTKIVTVAGYSMILKKMNKNSLLI